MANMQNKNISDVADEGTILMFLYAVRPECMCNSLLNDKYMAKILKI